MTDRFGVIWRAPVSPSAMVTMNSDKVTAKRRTDNSISAVPETNVDDTPVPFQTTNLSLNTQTDDSPNRLLYKKMEKIVEKMQDETTGVPVKTVKSFMSKIPSVFTGSDLILWMSKNLDVEDQIEALHLSHLMAAHGYFFPIDDHMLTVKNDNTFYRFQTPYFWPSNCWEPENTDYAVYLCKRTMQNKTRLELADYEAENLARLQKMFSRKWEFIFMQAEAQSKVDKKRDKLERKVLDSQERAFWDVHRPMPGCVNTTEVDIKKACQMNKTINFSISHSNSNKAKGANVTTSAPAPATTAITNVTISSTNATNKSSTNVQTNTSPINIKKLSLNSVKRQVEMLRSRLDRRNIKISKVAEALVAYYDQNFEYDSFFVPPEYANPWISDNIDYWEADKQAKDVSARRVKRWAFNLKELLQDPIGRSEFTKFLDKEFSGENLKFWEAVQVLKTLPQSQVIAKVEDIWSEYLSADATCPINVDSRSYEITKKNMENPDRWNFDCAEAHVYHLMKSDSYSRYLRSEMYKEFLNGSKKKTSVKGIRSIVSFSSGRVT